MSVGSSKHPSKSGQGEHAFNASRYSPTLHDDGPFSGTVMSTELEVTGGVERGVVGCGTVVDLVGEVEVTTGLDFVVEGR